MIRAAVIAVLALALSPAALSAWGLDGHRIVCEIAWQEMSQETRSTVVEMLSGDESSFRRFSESCTWADTRARDDQRFARDTARHFVNIGDDDTAVDPERHCSDVCVVEAIELYREILAGRRDPDRSPREALKFVGHFVGDIHQPLHAAFGSDLGGNGVSIRYFGRDPECRVQNGRRSCRFQLHRLWDSLLIGGLMGPDRTADQYARDLRAQITDEERTAWAAGGPLDWANESVTLVTTRIYPVADGVEIDAAYQADHGPEVEQRLQQAGVRLARLLEESLQ